MVTSISKHVDHYLLTMLNLNYSQKIIKCQAQALSGVVSQVTDEPVT